MPHIRRIGEEKYNNQGCKVNPARRWVVERTIAWMSHYRGLLVRWKKKVRNYLAAITDRDRLESLCERVYEVETWHELLGSS